MQRQLRFPSWLGFGSRSPVITGMRHVMLISTRVSYWWWIGPSSKPIQTDSSGWIGPSERISRKSPSNQRDGDAEGLQHPPSKESSATEWFPTWPTTPRSPSPSPYPPSLPPSRLQLRCKRKRKMDLMGDGAPCHSACLLDLFGTGAIPAGQFLAILFL